jgi:hypothetical protein
MSACWSAIWPPTEVRARDPQLRNGFACFPPRAIFGFDDCLFVIVLILGVLLMGGTETRSNDPFASPRGTHPVVLAIAIGMIAVLPALGTSFAKTGGGVGIVGFAATCLVAMLVLIRWALLARDGLGMRDFWSRAFILLTLVSPVLAFSIPVVAALTKR